MRKILLVLIIVGFFVVGKVSASEKRPRFVDVGLVAAPSLNWGAVSTLNYKSTGLRIGGMYAVMVDINLAKTSSNYYFSTGIGGRHLMFGYKCKDKYYIPLQDKTDVDLKSKQANVYLFLPTTFKMKTNPFGRFIIFGQVGLEHAILLSAKSKDEILKADGSTMSFDKVERYKQTSIIREALIVTAGIEFVIKDRTKATAAISYNYGFNNIFRKKYINQYWGNDAEGNPYRVKDFGHVLELQIGFIF
ncbi:MAG: PorT family protein [Bacteroidales bacterium]|jgi:hypothetical protein|nr:PorT family protein [Bacteroidales bacterium]